MLLKQGKQIGFYSGCIFGAYGGFNSEMGSVQIFILQFTEIPSNL